MGASLTISSATRVVEDCWVELVGGSTRWVAEEDARRVVAAVLAREGVAPEVLSFVLVAKFLGDGGATLEQLLEKEMAAREFVLGYEKDEENETAEGEGEAGADEEESESDFLVCDGVYEEAECPAPEAGPLECAKRLLLAATSIMAGCAEASELLSCPDSVQEMLLAVVLQQPSLVCAALLHVPRMRVLAGLLNASGMRVSPVWLPHLEKLDLAETLAFWGGEAMQKMGTEDGCVPVPHHVLGPFEYAQTVEVKKVFLSGHAPKLVEVELETGIKKLMVLKYDDLKPDFAVVNMLRVLNSLWLLGRVRSQAVTFDCIPLTANVGLMEFVPDSVPLNEWSSDKILSFSASELDTFLTFASGCFTGCFVLGVRDRHRDNFMVQKDVILWELDFKHIFNHLSTGVDAPRFAVPRAMKNALLRRGAWEQFKMRCAKAMICLRRHSSLIVQLCRATFRNLAEDDAIQQCVAAALFLSKSEAEAIPALSSYIEVSVYSLKKFVKNQLHMANLGRMSKRSGSLGNL